MVFSFLWRLIYLSLAMKNQIWRKLLAQPTKVTLKKSRAGYLVSINDLRIKWKHSWDPPFWKLSLCSRCLSLQAGCGGCMSCQPSQIPFRWVFRCNSSLPGDPAREDKIVPSSIAWVWPWILFFGILSAQFLFRGFRRHRSSICNQSVKLMGADTNGIS